MATHIHDYPHTVLKIEVTFLLDELGEKMTYHLRQVKPKRKIFVLNIIVWLFLKSHMKI